MNLTRQHVLDEVARRRDELSRLGVRRLALFGSTAREESTDESDLDFLVEFETKSFDAYMDVKFLLDDMFDRHVDLVLTDSVKPRLRASIGEEAVDVPGL
jgi:predicted nucleotidyltransferase